MSLVILTFESSFQVTFRR